MAMDEDLLQDFLTEAGDLLEDVDQKLVELESRPDDKALLNTIFRGFHTIKGGAGFLDAQALVDLCHRTENLFDQLRSDRMTLSPELLDVILSATGEVRRMFGELAQVQPPSFAPRDLLDALDYCIEHGAAPGADGASAESRSTEEPAADAMEATASSIQALPRRQGLLDAAGELDWQAMLDILTGATVTVAKGNDFDAPAAKTDSSAINHALQTQAEALAAISPAVADPAESVTQLSASANALPGVSAKPTSKPNPTKPAAKPPAEKATGSALKENTIRVETARFDQILNLSGEIGLTKNRLNCLKSAFLREDTQRAGSDNAKNEDNRKQLESVLGQLDMLVSDLQTAVMKARMQPVGRVFQKYGRLARDVARSLGKDVELVIKGAETEVDKTILEELNDPLIHLVRNAVDHGIEAPVNRIASGKPARGTVEISARQAGDHILIEIRDDGKGMRPDDIRAKAIEKGIISYEEGQTLDANGALQLIFAPGFSTKDQISDISGRGVGMDVVKTNISKLKGRIEIDSRPGEGSRFIISLPLTLAILPVLMMKCQGQIYSVPLSTVREIISIDSNKLQRVGNRPTLVIRGEVLPVLDLAQILGSPRDGLAEIGVIATSHGKEFVLAVDGLVGQDEVMIKPLDGLKPKGVSGATLSGEGVLVLVLELHELLEGQL